MTAIIDVEDGDIQSITWDQGCTFCADSECIDSSFDFAGDAVDNGDKSCMVNDDDCIGGASGEEVGSQCPLQVYVVWTGTDADGNYLRSSELKFSNFKSYSLLNFADSLENQWEEVKDYSEYADPTRKDK
jgi:hypothetical protein